MPDRDQTPLMNQHPIAVGVVPVDPPLCHLSRGAGFRLRDGDSDRDRACGGSGNLGRGGARALAHVYAVTKARVNRLVAGTALLVHVHLPVATADRALISGTSHCAAGSGGRLEGISAVALRTVLGSGVDVPLRGTERSAPAR